MNELNSHQQKFLELADRVEKGQKLLKELKKELDEEMRMMAIGEIFQDPENGVVYQIIAPYGNYIYYKAIDYIRTRRK